MLDFNPNKTNCTGCTACKSVCPTGCIKMEADDEGFLYPVEYDGCIHCGLCEKVCPMCNPENIPAPDSQRVIAAVSKDFDVWRRSASGGAFSEICRCWGDADTMVVGAVMEDLYVYQKAVTGFDNIAPLCKSKYVSSDLKNTFRQILSHLKDGHKVIFCGCPCQVAGLRKFLRKKYDKLLLIDLICHGTGSPKVFKECMNVISEDLGARVVNYEFRAKTKVYEADHIARIKYEGGNCLSRQDPYTSLFLSQKCLRPSCGEHCIYRTNIRQGDITLADCKGLTEIFPDLIGCKRNYSSIISNTSLGESVVSLLSQTMETRPYNIDFVKKYNPLFYRHTVSPKNRDAFFEEFLRNPENAIRKWGKPFKIYSPSLRSKLLSYAPQWVRKYAVKIYRIFV